eukprot:TRINITY_DN3828_c0_g3_i1.p1 TRINITY_DN3828_c0_g3~~TRINITY_DN3828_c0_g3_i1.p1  ORF type:complete len:2624 (-),score=561.08 TRINITY_DN3828_c0_g3_i1:435-8306(-)
MTSSSRLSQRTPASQRTARSSDARARPSRAAAPANRPIAESGLAASPPSRHGWSSPRVEKQQALSSGKPLYTVKSWKPSCEGYINLGSGRLGGSYCSSSSEEGEERAETGHDDASKKTDKMHDQSPERSAKVAFDEKGQKKKTGKMHDRSPERSANVAFDEKGQKNKTGKLRDRSPERSAKLAFDEKSGVEKRDKNKNKNSAYYESSSEEEEDFLTSDRLLTHDGKEFTDEMIIEAISTFTMDASSQDGNRIMGRLAALIGSEDGELSSGFSKQFIQMSHLQAELGTALRCIKEQVSELDSLSTAPPPPGDASGQAMKAKSVGLLTGMMQTSETRTEEVAQRMRLIRRTLQSLNWPNLHHEFSKWVRSSAGYEQNVREFLRQVETRDGGEDADALLDQDAHPLSLSGYELLITRKLRDFSEDLSTVARDVTKDDKNKKRGDSRARDKVKLDRALARKALDQERVIRKAENRKEFMSKLTQSIDMDSKLQQEPESDPSEPASPMVPPTQRRQSVEVSFEQMVDTMKRLTEPSGTAKQLGGVAKQPSEAEKRREEEEEEEEEEVKEAAITEDADDNFDINKLDDHRYGHLKRIYLKHEQRLEELNEQFVTQSEKLEKVQASLETTMSRLIEVQKAHAGARSGTMTHEAAQKKISGQGRRNAIPAGQVVAERRGILLQEREDLVYQLQALTLELNVAAANAVGSPGDGEEGSSSPLKSQEVSRLAEKSLNKHQPDIPSDDLTTPRNDKYVGDLEEQLGQDETQTPEAGVSDARSNRENETDVDFEELNAMQPDKKLETSIAILDRLKKRAAQVVGEMNKKADSLMLGQACNFEFQPEVQVRMLVSPLKPEMDILQKTSEQYLQKLPTASAAWQQLSSTLERWLDTVKAEAANRQDCLQESKELNRVGLIEDLASNNAVLIDQLIVARDEILKESMTLQDQNRQKSGGVFRLHDSAKLSGDSAKLPGDIKATTDDPAAVQTASTGKGQPSIKLGNAPKDGAAVKVGREIPTAVTAVGTDALEQLHPSSKQSETKKPKKQSKTQGLKTGSENGKLQREAQVGEKEVSDEAHPHEGSCSDSGESFHEVEVGRLEEAKHMLEDRLKQAQDIIEVHNNVTALEQEITAMRKAIQKTKNENSRAKGRASLMARGSSNSRLSNSLLLTAGLPAPLSQTLGSQTRKSVAIVREGLDDSDNLEAFGEDTEKRKSIAPGRRSFFFGEQRKNVVGEVRQEDNDKDLYAMIRSTERKRHVLLKQRNNKFNALKRVLEKANLLRELGVKANIGPETDAQRSERFGKELADAKENSKRLSKMVDFWSTRISNREDMLVQEKQKLALEFGPNWERRLSKAVFGVAAIHSGNHGDASGSDDDDSSSSTSSSDVALQMRPVPANARVRRTSVVDMNVAAGDLLEKKVVRIPNKTPAGPRRLSLGLTFEPLARDASMQSAVGKPPAALSSSRSLPRMLNARPGGQQPKKSLKLSRLKDILSAKWSDRNKEIGEGLFGPFRIPHKQDLRDKTLKDQRDSQHQEVLHNVSSLKQTAKVRSPQVLQQAILEKWQGRSGDLQLQVGAATADAGLASAQKRVMQEHILKLMQRKNDSLGRLGDDNDSSQNLKEDDEDSQVAPDQVAGATSHEAVRQGVLKAFGGRPQLLSSSRNPAFPIRKPEQREVVKTQGVARPLHGGDESPSLGGSTPRGVDSPIEPHEKVRDSLEQFVRGISDDSQAEESSQVKAKGGRATGAAAKALSTWLKPKKGPDAAVIAGAAEKLLKLRKGRANTGPTEQGNSRTGSDSLQSGFMDDISKAQDAHKGMRGKLTRNRQLSSSKQSSRAARNSDISDSSRSASRTGESSSRSTSRASSRAGPTIRTNHASESRWRREKKKEKEADFSRAIKDFERRKRKRRKTKQASATQGWKHFRGVADFVEFMGENDDMQEQDEEPFLQQKEHTESDALLRKARAQLKLLKLGDKRSSMMTELVDMIDQSKSELDGDSVIDRKTRELCRWCGYEPPYGASGDIALKISLGDSIWDLENSVGHSNQKLLERVRVAVQNTHGGYRDGWLAMSVPGAIGPRMTRGSLLCGLKKLGFTKEEAGHVFHLGTALDALDLSFAAELREDQFHIMLRNAEQIESFEDLRERIHTKFGRSRIDEIFRRRDDDRSGSLEADEFAALCYAVGGNAVSATRFFLMMAEQHESKPGKRQELKVSSDAFLLSLHQARALDEVQRLRKVLRRKWRRTAVGVLFQKIPKEYRNEPVNAGQLSDALKSIGLFADGTETMRLARRRGGGRIVWMQDVLLRILAGYGHYLRTLTWDLTAQCVLKHEARTAFPFGGSVTSGSEDDGRRKDHGRSFSAPPAKSGSKSGLVVDVRSQQADSSPTSNTQGTKPRHRAMDDSIAAATSSQKDLVRGKHSSPVKSSPRAQVSQLAAPAASESKLSLSIAADFYKHQDLHEHRSTDVAEAVEEDAGDAAMAPHGQNIQMGSEKLPPRGFNGVAAAPLKTEKLPPLPSARQQAESGPPAALEAISRPSTTPALPPVKEVEPRSSRPATSRSTQEVARSPWWDSTGIARSPRFAASQTGAALLPGTNQDDQAKERDRQLRAHQWAQVGARIGAVPADSPLLKLLPSNGSSASGKSPGQ